MQKLSLLITEAYKDAHQKSVQVRNPFFLVCLFSSKLQHFIHFWAYRNEILLLSSGYEGKDKQSCPEFRTAARTHSSVRNLSDVTYMHTSWLCKMDNFVYKGSFIVI